MCQALCKHDFVESSDPRTLVTSLRSHSLFVEDLGLAHTPMHHTPASRLLTPEPHCRARARLPRLLASRRPAPRVRAARSFRVCSDQGWPQGASSPATSDHLEHHVREDSDGLCVPRRVPGLVPTSSEDGAQRGDRRGEFQTKPDRARGIRSLLRPLSTSRDTANSVTYATILPHLSPQHVRWEGPHRSQKSVRRKPRSVLPPLSKQTTSSLALPGCKPLSRARWWEENLPDLLWHISDRDNIPPPAQKYHIAR